MPFHARGQCRTKTEANRQKKGSNAKPICRQGVISRPLLPAGVFSGKNTAFGAQMGKAAGRMGHGSRIRTENGLFLCVRGTYGQTSGHIILVSTRPRESLVSFRGKSGFRGRHGQPFPALRLHRGAFPAHNRKESAGRNDFFPVSSLQSRKNIV